MRLGRVKAIVVRDVKLVARSRMQLFWILVFPLILLSGYVALFAPGGGQGAVEVRVAVVPGAPSAQGVAARVAGYLEGMRWNEGFEVGVNATVYGDLGEALSRLRRGYLDAVVVVYPGGVNATVYLLRGTSNPVREELAAALLRSFFAYSAHFSALELLSGYVNSSVEECPRLAGGAGRVLGEAWRIASGRGVRFVGVTAGGGEARPRVVGWMTLSVVFMNFMFGGILGGANMITSEVRRGFAERLLSTALRPSEYYAGITLSWLLVLSASSLPVAALGFGVYGGALAVEPLSPGAVYVAAVILLAELLAFSLGVLIGLLARTPEAAAIAANVVIWATMIGGGFWMPKSMLPGFLRVFADYNVLSVLFYAAVDVAVYGRSVASSLAPALAAAAITAALFAAAAAAYTRYLPRLLEEASG